MSFRVRPLRSGSSGNCLLAWTETSAVLVDAGITERGLGDELASCGLDLARLQAIVVTHAHADHLGCARKVTRGARIPLLVSDDAARAMPPLARSKRVSRFTPGDRLSVGDLTIETIRLSHDAPGTVACVVTDGAARFGVATDLGRSSESLEAALRTCDAFLLEHNHDEGMLRDGPYAWRLKRRVLGEEGHISNDQAADLLQRSLSARTRAIYLAHLSRHNNTPERALAAARRALSLAGREDVALHVAPPDTASAPWPG